MLEHFSIETMLVILICPSDSIQSYENPASMYMLWPGSGLDTRQNSVRLRYGPPQELIAFNVS